MQDDDEFEAQHTPSPQASPALRRLRKGPRPQVTPTMHVSESEAKMAEDIPAASAEEKQAEERVPTSPITEEAVPEVNVLVPDPPAPQVEVENPEAATTEANDAPAPNVQPDTLANAIAPVPPPRPHTIEQAFYLGELVTVRWPILVPPPTPGPQFDYHVEHMPQVQKPKPRLPRFPGTATSP